MNRGIAQFPVIADLLEYPRSCYTIITEPGRIASCGFLDYVHDPRAVIFMRYQLVIKISCILTTEEQFRLFFLMVNDLFLIQAGVSITVATNTTVGFPPSR